MGEQPTGGQQDPRIITDEVKYWLGLSAIFAECFRLKEHLGTSWFLINVLLSEPGENPHPKAVGEALRAFGLTRSNPAYDLATYLGHLREMRLIDLIADGHPVQLTSQHRTLPANTVIVLKPAIHAGSKRYVQNVVEGLFGREAGDASRASARKLMNEIYQFMRNHYIPIWESFLTEVAQQSTSMTRKSVATLHSKLRANTEVFVVFHALWAARLSGDDVAGFDSDDVYHLHARTRRPEKSALNRCLELLSDHQIFTSIQESDGARFRLNDAYAAAFGSYSAKFVPIRSTLRQYLEPHVIKLTLGK